MKVVLVGAVEGTRAAIRSFARPGVELHVFGLDPARTSRHSDFADLSAEAAAVGARYRPILDLNDAPTLQVLRGIAPDLICVFGWSRMVGPEVMQIPTAGVLGWHPSPLPENRGRAVIPWTILQRRRSSAMTIFWISDEVDAGDIAAQVPVEVAPDETASTLYAKVMAAGARAIDQLLALGHPTTWPRRPQDHSRATYCGRRTPEDGRLDWSGSAGELWTLIRATTHPYPGARTSLAGTELTVWAAEVARGTGVDASAGQVVARRSGHLVVRCGDGADLVLTDWTTSEGLSPKPGDRLGT